MQKYLLWKSSSSLDIFILNSSSKKTAVKNFLFSRSGCSVEFSLRKRSFSEKMTPAKKWLFWKSKKGEDSSCSEEIAAPKKLMLCRRSYSEKVWISSFYQNKVVLKKWQHIRKGNRYLKKRNQIRLAFIHGESEINNYQNGRNRPRKESLDYVCVIIFS